MEGLSPFSKLLALLLVLAPFASLALHLALRPKFWTPSLLLFGCYIGVLGAGEYIHSHSLWFAIRNGVVFAFLLFCISVVIGVVWRAIDHKTYADAERAAMADRKTWRAHSRHVAVIAFAVGLMVFGMSWFLLTGFEIKGSLLAAFCFYLAWGYWRAPGGAPSTLGWILRGNSEESSQKPSERPPL